jgi:hypothetical protein
LSRDFAIPLFIQSNKTIDHGKELVKEKIPEKLHLYVDNTVGSFKDKHTTHKTDPHNPETDLVPMGKKLLRIVAVSTISTGAVYGAILNGAVLTPLFVPKFDVTKCTRLVWAGSWVTTGSES